MRTLWVHRDTHFLATHNTLPRFRSNIHWPSQNPCTPVGSPPFPCRRRCVGPHSSSPSRRIHPGDTPAFYTPPLPPGRQTRSHRGLPNAHPAETQLCPTKDSPSLPTACCERPRELQVQGMIPCWLHQGCLRKILLGLRALGLLMQPPGHIPLSANAVRPEHQCANAMTST